MKTLQLRKGKESSLLRFHPWIFSGALTSVDESVAEGDLVRVVDAKGQFLALGHYEKSSLAVRILSFTPCNIDAAFWHERLTEAWELRRSLGLIGQRDNNIFRLVHGEGDRLPGLIVDIYDHTAVMQAHSAGMHYARQAIADAIVSSSKGWVTAVYYKSETTLPYKAHLDAKNEYLVGDDSSATEVAQEYGLRFHIDWLNGQKTGFFVDQRENRHLIERYAHGRSVLNMFCYTGGFSVSALRGGATLVHSVDASTKAIDLTNANVALNFPGDTRHEGFAEDAFHFLGRIPQPCPYDLIVLDPPAFAKHQSALRNAIKGYTRLNAAALRQIKPGGILFTFSCSQAVSKEQFRLAVFTAAAETGRHVRILHQLHQPADHPVSIYHPEGEYLKGLVLYVS